MIGDGSVPASRVSKVRTAQADTVWHRNRAASGHSRSRKRSRKKPQCPRRATPRSRGTRWMRSTGDAFAKRAASASTAARGANTRSSSTLYARSGPRKRACEALAAAAGSPHTHRRLRHQRAHCSATPDGRFSPIPNSRLGKYPSSRVDAGSSTNHRAASTGR